MVSGIRSATSQVIATATIVAYGGLGGLGRFIIDGYSTSNYGEVAAAPCSWRPWPSSSRACLALAAAAGRPPAGAPAGSRRAEYVTPIGATCDSGRARAPVPTQPGGTP